MKIAASVTALSATPHVRTSQAKQYNAKSNRYLMNVAMDEEGDEQFSGEGEESHDWAEEGEEQVRNASKQRRIAVGLAVPFALLCMDIVAQGLCERVADVPWESGT